MADAGTEVAIEDRVALLRSLDPAAWDALHGMLFPRLLAYAGARLDREPARDAVAEAMSRAVATVERYEPRGLGIEAWIFGILRHVVIDAQRDRHRGDGRATPDWSWQPPGPDDRLLVAEEHAAVREAFTRLDPGDREVLELRVVAGLSSDEVGTILGRRPGAVRMAQTRALARLRSLLEVPS